MVTKQEISIYDFVSAISEAIDLVSRLMNNHHKRVAYISCAISKEMNLSDLDTEEIVLAAMLHDIGAFSIKERVQALTYENYNDEIDKHSKMGSKLLKPFKPLKKAALLIDGHHAEYDKFGDSVPLGSQVIHLADRVAAQFESGRDALEKAPAIIEKIREDRQKYHPGTLAAFEDLGKREYFWIEACAPSLGESTIKHRHFSGITMDMHTIHDFAKIISRIIDFRSRFTATHSSGVAATAMELTEISGFSEIICRQMLIAGYFHDVGKLAVSNDILEKNGPLTDSEFNTVKKHTYFTYRILNKIQGLDQIAEWAAYHHEKQGGDGYPFHVKGEEFSELAQIMAVADIMTAITEDRPYRLGMEKAQAEKVLLSVGEKGALDKSVISLAVSNFDRLNAVRDAAQQKARKEYENFYNEDGQGEDK